MSGEPYDPSDNHTRLGIIMTLLGALLIALVITNPFKTLIFSQIALSIQLPWTIVLQILLTSNPRVMGKYANNTPDRVFLWTTTVVVSGLNVLLLVDTLRNLLR
jgi:manganese transport protein